jgi:uncharacterized OB-fold protein
MTPRAPVTTVSDKAVPRAGRHVRRRPATPRSQISGQHGELSKGYHQMMLDVTTKPRPVPTAVSQPYWDGLREHRLLMQRCATCQQLQFYPRSGCRHCGGTDLSWEQVSGTGRIYSYTIIHRAPFEAFAADVPYVYAIIQLDEGPRVVATVETSDHDSLTVDTPVTAIFDDGDDGITLLRFRPQ